MVSVLSPEMSGFPFLSTKQTKKKNTQTRKQVRLSCHLPSLVLPVDGCEAEDDFKVV